MLIQATQMVLRIIQGRVNRQNDSTRLDGSHMELTDKVGMTWGDSRML
jgi:hypothetical protein